MKSREIKNSKYACSAPEILHQELAHEILLNVDLIRHRAASRKVVGLISGGIFEIFLRLNPSGSTMALGSTQPLTEIITGIFPGGKGGRCVGLILSLYCAEWKSWEPQRPGIFGAYLGLQRNSVSYNRFDNSLATFRTHTFSVID
jgi:hypothetical protein